MRSNNGCTRIQCKNISDEGVSVTLVNNHVSYLNHWVLFWLRKDTFSAGALNVKAQNS